MSLPLRTTGTLSPTCVLARPVCLAIKLSYAFTLCARFPTVLREPLSASVTFWEATAPVKLPGEQPNPGDLLQPQDVMSRHRGAKPPRRGGLLGEISLLSPG